MDIINDDSLWKGLFYVSIYVMHDCVAIREDLFYVFLKILVFHATTFVGSFYSLLFILFRFQLVF